MPTPATEHSPVASIPGTFTDACIYERGFAVIALPVPFQERCNGSGPLTVLCGTLAGCGGGILAAWLQMGGEMNLC